MDQYDKDLLFRLYIQGYVECAALKKKWHKVIFSSPKQKSSFIEFKSIGNMYYAGREYRKALICYNKALCHAVKGSEDVGVLFSNRSAVAFEMKLYPECMKNIQLARENNYPKDNLLKLKKREEKCMEMISSMKTLPNGNDSENLIDLLYGSLQWPYMIDCLEIVHKKNENPYLITKRDLKAGDMIAKDKPFVGILSENNLNINCFNCMKECILDLIPCDKCALVMFCSENCKESGFQVHQYECGIIDHMISVFGWKSLKEHNKCRALFKALSIFNGSVENLMEFVNETNKSSQEMITLEMCNNEKAFLKAICSINNRSDDDLYIEYFYSFYPKIKEMMANKDFRKFVTGFTKTIPIAIKTELITLTKMNGGHHPLELVLSLSCAPNVFSLILNDSKIIYSVQHPIKAGEKLTIGNNCNFAMKDKMLRQQMVLDKFQKKCECVACVNNYPMMEQLKTISPSFLLAAISRKEEAKRLTGIRAFNMFNENFKYINNNFENFPCKEIAMMMYTNSLLLSKIGSLDTI